MKFLIASLLTVSVCLGSSPVSADPVAPPTVQVTSFQNVIPNQPLAELCGRVVGGNGESPQYIQALVDAPSNPGVYHTLVGPTGRFCMTLVTYRGNARVSVWLPSGSCGDGTCPAPAPAVTAQMNEYSGRVKKQVD